MIGKWFNRSEIGERSTFSSSLPLHHQSVMAKSSLGFALWLFASLGHAAVRDNLRVQVVMNDFFWDLLPQQLMNCTTTNPCQLSFFVNMACKEKHINKDDFFGVISAPINTTGHEFLHPMGRNRSQLLANIFLNKEIRLSTCPSDEYNFWFEAHSKTRKGKASHSDASLVGNTYVTDIFPARGAKAIATDDKMKHTKGSHPGIYNISLTFSCAPNYFGNNCLIFCEENPYYTCNHTDGTKVCRHNYYPIQGNMCLLGKLSQYKPPCSTHCVKARLNVHDSGTAADCDECGVLRCPSGMMPMQTDPQRCIHNCGKDGKNGCLHGGHCLEQDGSDAVCECYNTEYTGEHCQDPISASTTPDYPRPLTIPVYPSTSTATPEPAEPSTPSSTTITSSTVTPSREMQHTTGGVNPPAPPDGPMNPSKRNAGLGTGAIIGIALAVLFVAILVGVGGYRYYRGGNEPAGAAGTGPLVRASSLIVENPTYNYDL